MLLWQNSGFVKPLRLLLSFISWRANREITHDRDFRRLSKFFFLCFFSFLILRPGIKTREHHSKNTERVFALFNATLNARSKYMNNYLFPIPKNDLTINRRNTVHQFILIFFFILFFLTLNSRNFLQKLENSIAYTIQTIQFALKFIMPRLQIRIGRAIQNYKYIFVRSEISFSKISRKILMSNDLRQFLLLHLTLGCAF